MNCYYCHKSLGDDPIYGLHGACFVAWFELPTFLEFKELDPKSSSLKVTSPEIKKKVNTFFHGQYLKYSARLNNTEYILKVQEPEFPDLPATEFLCNQIAVILGLEVPKHYLIDFSGRPTFVSRNFMQDHIGALQHIYKFLPNGEDDHTCEVISRVILEQTGKLADVARFIEICLYDAFVGNNDRHGRNLGLIQTAVSTHLSPMYDNPSILGTQEEFMLEAHFNPSGSIWTLSSKEPKAIDYIQEFVRLGHKKVVDQFSSRLVSKYPAIIKAIELSPLGTRRKLALLKLFNERIESYAKNK